MTVVTLSGFGLPSDQIHRQLRDIILAGRIGVGERLPPVRQLARDLGVASGTVAKAYRLLEQDGLVVSRSGNGTRVSALAHLPPADVVRSARALVEVAGRHGLTREETISALRMVWTEADD